MYWLVKQYEKKCSFFFREILFKHFLSDADDARIISCEQKTGDISVLVVKKATYTSCYIRVN